MFVRMPDRCAVRLILEYGRCRPCRCAIFRRTRWLNLGAAAGAVEARGHHFAQAPALAHRVEIGE